MVADSYANFGHTPSTSSATYPGRPASLLEALQQRPARSKHCVSDRIEPVAMVRVHARLWRVETLPARRGGRLGLRFHAYERGELLELEQKNS